MFSFGSMNFSKSKCLDDYIDLSHHENVHANASETTHGDCKKVLRKMKSYLRPRPRVCLGTSVSPGPSLHFAVVVFTQGFLCKNDCRYARVKHTKLFEGNRLARGYKDLCFSCLPLLFCS